MDIFSWLIYTLFMVAMCALACQTERSGYNPLWLFATYVLVVGFWAIRYQIGFDYEGYMEIFSDIKHNRSSYVEPGYYLLNRLFSAYPSGYVGVMFVMAALIYFVLFKLFVRERILLYGLFFSLAFQFQFMIASQMRQALVIAVFLYALRFIEEKKYWRYILLMAAMMTMHTTAGFMVAALIMAKIRLPKPVWFLLIVGVYGLYLAGIFETLGTQLMTALPLYARYQSSMRMEAGEVGFSIVMLFWIVMALCILYYSRIIDRPVLFNIYMCGIVLYIMFIEFHLLNRLMAYFTFINVLLVSILCKNNFRKGLPVALLAFVVFNLLTAKTPNYYGIQPYRTIFEEKIKKYE